MSKSNKTKYSVHILWFRLNYTRLTKLNLYVTELRFNELFYDAWQILAAMQRELAASGLSPEEILAKTLLLQKAMAGDNSPAFINKTLKE